MENISTSSKTRIPLEAPSVLILTQSGEENWKRTKNFTTTSINTKKLNHVQIQHIIVHLSFRQISH